MFKHVAFAVALFAMPVSGQADTRDLVTSFDLDNGMQVVVIEDHRAPVVVHMVWYKAGSADEKAGASGVAHFLEHLLFKGTKTLKPGEFSRRVAENGGDDNAFTSYDYTAYFQRVAADRLGLMMQMESDRMVNLQLGEEDIKTERDVIIEERNQRTDNDPSSLFREQVSAAQYMNHRYGVPVIGWRHEVEQLTLKDALEYYQEYYAPNNAILVVAGDVRPDEVKNLAQEYYAEIKPNEALKPRARLAEPPQRAERRVVYRDARVAQPQLMRTYLAPERDAGDQKTAAALTILAELLGGGQTSFLADKMQFSTQTAVYAGAFYGDVNLDATTFGLYVVPSPNVSLQQAEDALDVAIAEFIETPIKPEDMDRIKMQLRASEIYARDDVGALAREYGAALASGLTVADVQEWPQLLQAVTEEDVKTAAKMVFDRKKSVTGWMMSDAGDSK